MLDDVLKQAKEKMQKSVDSLQVELTKIRSGRAHPSLLDQIFISYYGSDTPLNQVANISVEDARTLAISPWEKTLIPQIEKAIMSANLGLNPATSGNLIRVPLPPLTEERRKEMVKLVRSEAENARVAVRNIRRDANGNSKDLLKDKLITEDDDRQAQDKVQKLTDAFIKEVDTLLSRKEAELMEV